MVDSLPITDFLKQAQRCTVFDVRSPSEFESGHIPKALQMPLFTDAERHEVGLSYKQQGREAAIKLGLDYVGPRLRSYIETAETNSTSKEICMYCWRGGMRSASLAWLLSSYGFNVHILHGGYKAFRNFVLDSFNQEYRFIILGGNTGSGKTKLLKVLRMQGECVIDLEELARHKGSAFGALGEGQPIRQEQFENDLGLCLWTTPQERIIWLEDESRRIGPVNIPKTMWERMLVADLLYVVVPRETRIQNIINDYASFAPSDLQAAIGRISKRMGSEQSREAIMALESGDVSHAIDVCLVYYDKYYVRSLQLREETKIYRVACEGVDLLHDAGVILNYVRDHGP